MDEKATSGAEAARRRQEEADRLVAALSKVPSSRRAGWAPPRWPHREQRLEYWLGLVAQEVTGRLQRLLGDFGVSYAEWGAMAILARRRHAYHVELTQVTGMSKGGVSKMMGRLDRIGLVVREADVATTWMADASRAPWELTSLGWATLQVLEAAADENESVLFDHRAPEQRRGLALALQRLARHHRWGEADREGRPDLRATPGEGPLASAPSPVRRRQGRPG
jgi:DNA-binding MarR family transcriptional regulator